MASPQKENGYVKIANELVEALQRLQLSGYEMRYLWTLWRKTYGWNKKADQISQSQFVEETGIKKQHVWRTEQKLLQRNIVTKNGYLISFQKDYTKWKELPKLVTNKKVTKIGIGVTKIGTEVTKIGGHKRHYTKDTNTKDKVISKDITEKKKKITRVKREEVDTLKEYFLQTMNIPAEDCSQKMSRRYWAFLLKSVKGDRDRIEAVKWLIDLASQDEFYKNNITSSKDLYYKRIKLIARRRGDIPRVAVMSQ